MNKLRNLQISFLPKLRAILLLLLLLLLLIILLLLLLLLLLSIFANHFKPEGKVIRNYQHNEMKCQAELLPNG